MNVYPKHYLADVPHDLRMRVLDLCIHRLWHDALDLLHQNGFTQYEWYELVWFHDHAPTILEPVGRSVAAEPSASVHSPTPGGPVSVPDSEISNPKCEIPPSCVAPPLNGSLNPEPQTENPEPLTLTPSEIQNRKSEIRNRRRPRSKACRLPADVRLSLNTMLAGGCRYRDIIHSLNTQGHPGFNKANLNAWKRTGFQDWLRNRNLHAPEDVQKVSGSCTEALGRSQKATEGDSAF